ncbi:MAG: PEGA domain-containing protein [Desulfobacterales bacterium]|nr:PEGA domain-containing protein [Desulfobacterales bacterium]
MPRWRSLHHGSGRVPVHLRQQGGRPWKRAPCGSSVPAGAQVYVDGTLKGTSPLSVEVPVGGHEVRLSMPDYYEWEAQVRVEKKTGEPLKVEMVPAE